MWSVEIGRKDKGVKGSGMQGGRRALAVRWREGMEWRWEGLKANKLTSNTSQFNFELYTLSSPGR